MKLVIAEKPSVAQSIAKVLGAAEKKDGYLSGNGYLVSWCVGHLIELADATVYNEAYAKWRYEDLPILPEHWQLVVAKDKSKQFKILKDLMHNKAVSGLVCATDAGREGELIFRFVYEQAGCTKPFERLWISSMEDAAIKEGFQKLKNGRDYDNLYTSALCRSKADWLVGINATRLFSVLYGATLNVGRVQSPTLAMLVERSQQINGFQKEKYYHVRIACGGLEAVSDKMKNKTEAENVCTACQGKQAMVESVQQEQKNINPPKLFDLTTLQRTANRLYGFTAQQTLDYTQSLYEKKLVTYPRTDSQFLTGDMEMTAKKIISNLPAKLSFMEGFSFTPDVGRVINNAKVSDHHAIIPTEEFSAADLSAIPETEKAILILIAVQLLCATASQHTFEAVTAALDCGGFIFTAKGKTILQNGWKEIEQRFRASIQTKKKDKSADEDGDTAKALPPVSKGQTFKKADAAVTEHTTAPPKPYTEDTLLSAMETAGNEDLDKDVEVEKKGLGTPATRAAVIEKLMQSGVAERKGKQLIPTDKGIQLISVLPDPIKSPKLTAQWENDLTQISKGAVAPDVFMLGIRQMTIELVRNHHTVSEEAKARFQPQREVIGKCPRCGSQVVEGKQNFYCQNRNCQFSMWKNDRFFTAKKKTLTKKMAAELLSAGKTTVKGLYSEKKGGTYNAVVVISDTGEKYVNYKLQFPNRV